MAFANGPKIVTDGLVVSLDAADRNSYPGTGTTWTDLMGNYNTILTNGPVFSFANNGSIYFDGTDDYASFPTYYPVFTGDFAINLWAKFTRYIDYQNVISSADNGNVIQGFWLEFGYIRGFTLGTTGTQLILDDNLVDLRNLSINVWHNICVSRIGTGSNNLKLYVDNILCGQNSSNATVGSALENLEIARYAKDVLSGNSFFQGNVANLNIYSNRGLTATEVLQNYNTTKGRFGL